jgi:hypothetical protein
MTLAITSNDDQQTAANRSLPTLMAAAAGWQHEAISSSMPGKVHAACADSAHHGSTALEAAAVALPWLLAVAQAAATAGKSAWC